MKELIKDPILILIVFSILAVSTSFFNTISAIVIYTITILMIVFKDGKKSINRKSIFLFISFYFIVVLYSITGFGTLSSDTANYVIYTFISYFSVLMISYYIKTINKKQIFSLLIVFIAVFSFCIIGTTLVSYIDPMAIRMYGFGEIMNASSFDVEEASRYRSMGMMNYAMAHAMSVVSMGLTALICYSEKKWLKVICGILLVLTIRLLFVMTITTAMLLAAVGVTLLFANYFSKGRTVLAVLLFVLVFILFFFTGIVSSFLDYSQNNNTEIYAKLSDLFFSAETGAVEGQAGYRQKLYLTSFNTFLHNPLFGGGVADGSRRIIGGHSFFLDYLAYYGLFALMLFSSWWKESKTNGVFLPSKLKSCYYFSLIPLIGMVVLKAESVFIKMPFMALVFIQIVFLFLDMQIKDKQL